jgi:hypothetical protein
MRLDRRPILAFLARAALDRRVRWALLALLAMLALWVLLPGRSAAPDESLSPAETRKVYAALLRRAAAGGPNHLHSRRLYFYAPPFAEAAGANVDIVRAAALLHDSTKEDGDGEPKERFCTHGDQGAEYTASVLRELGKSEAFTARASSAVREHMGPCGFNWRWASRRFMSKFCKRSFPTPASAEAEVLYDVDMLDLMTVDGVVKVAELRQKNPEFEKEPLEASVRTGPDSAWKSVVDARQTLITGSARACGGDLASHTKAFVDGLDFAVVTDIPALKRAAATYLGAKPFPSCLPKVPAWDGSPMP